MKIHFHGLSNVGRRREKNEDFYLINPDLGLFMVADGMGGHLGGEYASRLAVTTVESILKTLEEDPDATVLAEVGGDPTNVGERLRYAIKVASYKIFERASRDPHLRGMGTTTVAVMVRDSTAYVANVGDSRVYLFRDGDLKQITEDHSLVTEQIKAGFLSIADARNHRLKNIITRSVGYQEDVEIDLASYDIQEKDRFLLCSDGLTSMVDDEEIHGILAHSDLKTACERLVDLANRHGGDDNITVVLIETTGT